MGQNDGVILVDALHVVAPAQKEYRLASQVGMEQTETLEHAQSRK